MKFTLTRRFWIGLAATPFLLVALFLIADLLFPLPPASAHFSTVVTARDGTPLRAFADDQGVWRYPIGIEQVSPRYLDALLGYEDRWFYRHPGINPVALARAGWQGLREGRVVSGGSTLTMQVARILDPHPRTVSGKLRQIFRALQLELHYSKQEILTIYLNRAPFGGPLEGVQAASLAYLGKPAVELSYGEAALLAVLPQLPSQLRPDRHPERARAARDKVLERLAKFGIIDRQTADEAKMEQVIAMAFRQPMRAALLAERLRSEHATLPVIQSTIDPGLQAALEEKVATHVASLAARTSAAVMVLNNQNLEVLAYIGSADLADEDRFGHVDMVTAERSPGSTLKPFLYGFALEDGLVHSESLLVDAPQSFDGYRPANFRGTFVGPVSVSEALQRSLNIPAVDLLHRFGPERFSGRLRNGGLRISIPGDGKPNLSLILGGGGARLEDLVGAYSALGRNGTSAKPRFLPGEPVQERHMLHPGAAWLVRQILEEAPRPVVSNRYLDIAGGRRVAWKTGTSYGFRDSWALGVTDDYTIGVWVGRPDGTPQPGQFGAVTAAPLLFDIVDSLPTRRDWTPPQRPNDVQRATICWPLGTAPESDDDPLCQQRREAWVLSGHIPPTLADRLQDQWTGYRVSYWVNVKNGRRVDSLCGPSERVKRELARWPTLLEPWLAPDFRARSHLPPPDRSCPRPPDAVRPLKLAGLDPEMVVRRAGPMAKAPSITLNAAGGQEALFWLVNGAFVATTAPGESFTHRFDKTGKYELTVLDAVGNFDRVEVTVIP